MRLLSVLLILTSVQVYSQKKASIKWYTFEEAVKLTQTAPKKIFVDVYTDWCGWCKVMDRNTFSNDTIAAYMNENYYPVKLNAEQKEDITLGNQTYKFVPNGRNGYHELAAALVNGKLSYPTVVFLNEKVEIIHVQPGYQKLKPFDQIARFIGDDFYLSTKWEDFVKSYDSPFPE